MARALTVIRTVTELRAAVAVWRRAGDTVGLVPTMGALHRGHLSLVTAARAACTRSVATIFVNPKQFAPREDFARYPRQEEADRALLESASCDLLFAPGADEVYPSGFSTAVTVARITDRWEGEARPGHFAGVATVVAKLLLQALPDKAFFGEKDFQQLQAVTRMTRDLDIPVAIVGCPTVREEDGLALSSRNVYLTPSERKTAPLLYRTISGIATAARGGGEIGGAIEAGKRALLDGGFAAIDYLALVDAATLEPLIRRDARAGAPPTRVIAAARLGAVRLIDNVAA